MSHARTVLLAQRPRPYSTFKLYASATVALSSIVAFLNHLVSKFDAHKNHVSSVKVKVITRT